MADNTKLIIELEVLLRNLNRTLRGLDQVKRKLDSVASVRFNQRASTVAIDRQAIAAQKIAQQQQRLLVQSQELANKQERARQVTERLNQSQQRLTITQQRLDQAQQRVARSAGQQANAHVVAFRALQRGLIDANHHVRFFRANEAALRKAPQLDAHVRAFRAIQKGAEDANRHVIAFRASQRALARAPQMDAHVRAFRAIEDGVRKAEREQRRFQQSTLTLEQSLGRVGGSLRNLGLGLTSLGTSLSVALTAPLTALGVLSARNAVTLDSLQRGLVAITGSASEAGQQLQRLTKIAKLPGIGFQEAIQGSIRLQAVGFSAEVAERALIQFSNAVALTGGGREELARITVQLGQLAAKGKVLAQDLKPIIEAGPAVGRALLQAFGTVNSEDIQALGLSSEEFIQRLLQQLEQLPRAAAGLRNTFDNFSDAVFRASAAIGGAILPVLTRLIEVAEPIITRLADGFARLPAPVQTLVVVFGALTAAMGPALFVLGQFATGIGGLISAFGRLHALGLLPTIEGFKLLTQVMRGSASLAAGQAATTAAAAGGWIALGGALLGVIALAGGIALLLHQQKDAVKISKEQIEATGGQIDALKEQIAFTDSLKTGVRLTADEQERLAQIYAQLNTEAKVRLTAITDEEQRLAALREELQRLLQLRNEERVQQAANLTASLAATAQQIRSGQAERDSIAARVRGNVELAKSITETGQLTTEHRRQLALQGIAASTVEEAIGGLNAENESLIESQGGLIKSAKELNGTAEEQAEALRLLQQQTGLSSRQLLSAAKAMGAFKGDIEATLPLIDAYIDGIKTATRVTDEFQRTLDRQSQGLLKAGDAVEALIKSDRALVNSAVALAKEATNSFTGARKTLEAFIAAQPRLALAIENERRRAGKSLSEFLDDILLQGADKKTQEVLRRQLDRVREARDRLDEVRASGQVELLQSRIQTEFEATKAGLDRELSALEANFDDRLIALRKYLSERKSLEEAQINAEIIKELELTSVLFQELSARGRAAEREFQTELKEIDADPKLRGRARQAAVQAAELKKAADIEKGLAEFRVKHGEATARVVELEKQRNNLGAELARIERNVTEEIEKQKSALQFDLLEQQGLTADAEAGRLKARFTETLRDLRIDTTGLSADLQQALNRVDLTTLQAKLDELPEPVRVLVELLEFGIKRAQIAEAAQLVDDLSAGLRLDEERIQNKVLDGLIDQREAQAQILVLQQQYRGVLLDVLQGELAKAEAIKDQGLIVSLRTQIAEVERLGVAIDEVGQQINQQLFSDLQSGLSGIFSGARRGFEGLRDAAISFGERLLDTLNDIAATSIVKQLEGLFKPDATNTKGTVGGFFSKLFGLQPKQQADAAAASAALQTGATSAAVTLQTGTAAASTTFATSVVTSATSFASAVIAAGAAFAASVIAAAGSEAATGGLGALLGGEAATGLFPAIPGGVYKVVEGGYPEAVLTTDPKHAARQLAILKAFLRETRGLGGRVRGLAAGGFAMPDLALNVPSISLPSGNFGDMEISSQQATNIRILNMLDKRQLVGGHLRSAEGAHDILNVISENSVEIGRRIGIK